jgi:hypothetical protein
MISLTACPVRTELEPSMDHTSCKVSSFSPQAEMTEDNNFPDECNTIELLTPVDRDLLVLGSYRSILKLMN